MRPRSCDSRHGARELARAAGRIALAPLAFAPVAIAFGLLIALGAAALTPALAAASSKVTVRSSGTVVTGGKDSLDVKEITIDDEGIRIRGTGKDITVPAPPPAPGVPDVNVKIDPSQVKVIRIGNDSLERILVQTHGDNEIVQFFRDVRVSKGERVGSVVAMFGNIRNEGVIGGDCVAIMGSIAQGDSAVILGDAVSLGGSLRESGPGSRVEGQTVSIGFLPFMGLTLPSLPLMIFFGLVAFLLFVGLAALAGRLFPERLVRMAETISRRTLLSLVLGLLSVPLALMLGLLLLVTVIGIPLALLLPFLFVLAAFLGYTAAAYLLGSKLLGRRLDPRGGLVGPIAAGTAFVTVFYLVAVPLMMFEGAARVVGVGFLMLWIVVGTVCWMLGIGALLLSRLGQEPKSTDAVPGAGGWTPAGAVPAGAGGVGGAGAGGGAGGGVGGVTPEAPPQT